MKKIRLLKKKPSKVTLCVALICGSVAAYADDSTYDPRAVAMGGTGVTTSNSRNAAFQNPAMLASTPRDSVAFEFPIISLRLQDENNLHSDVSTLKSNTNALSSAINAFQANPSQITAATAASAITNFNNSLAQASNKSLMGDIFAGAMLGIPGKNFAFSLFVDERVEAGALFAYATADQSTLSNISSALNTCAANQASCTSAAATVNGLAPNGTVNNLQSQLLVRGVRFRDVGITAAHHFDFLGGLDMGVTPKVSQLTTYDYAVNAQSTSLSLNQGEKGYSSYNMDVGVSKTFKAADMFKTSDKNEVKVGMVVKNMMSRSFTTILGNTISVKPQATVGASYLTDLTTTGIDLDVITNQPVVSGFSKESQYLRFGSEFDAWRWAQLRVGYRHDLKGNYPNLPSVGLGLSPFGLHVDLSVAYASQQEAVFSMQTGLNF